MTTTRKFAVTGILLLGASYVLISNARVVLAYTIQVPGCIVGTHGTPN